MRLALAPKVVVVEEDTAVAGVDRVVAEADKVVAEVDTAVDKVVTGVDTVVAEEVDRVAAEADTAVDKVVAEDVTDEEQRVAVVSNHRQSIYDNFVKNLFSVSPANAGVQKLLKLLDSSVRRNDNK